MKRLLSDCTLTALSTAGNDFFNLAQSFSYQANALGIALQQHETIDSHALSFEFNTPKTSPIHCDISRFDDLNKQTPITENIMQATCGLMSVHGRALGTPQALGINYLSTLTATLALQGVMAAALGQCRGLELKNTHISMAAAGLLSTAQYLAGATADEGAERLFPSCIKHPNSPPFVSADGVIFELETLDAKPWQHFCAALDLSSQLAGKSWTAFLQRYAKATSPVPNEIIEALARLEYAKILELAAQSKVAVCPVRTLAERAKDKDTQLAWQQGAWQFITGESTSLLNITKPTELPLSGITVLESCRRIQGPLAGHLLSLLGATVIRIEPPNGDPLRGMPPMADGVSARFDALNRHKTVREIDIKSAAGQAEIKELARVADVFIHNWAPNKATPLNLDYNHLHEVNPSLVYGYAAGWATAGDVDEALNERPGTDFMVQAFSGVAEKISKRSGKNGGSLFTVLDILGGVVAAQGITAALLKRELHPCSIRVTSSLLSAATLLTTPDLSAIYQADNVIPTPSLVDGVYATESGYIAVE
ncbi:partial Acetyl-CoA:oxalate CoA-transferase, partial [Candidatus Brocadiaceae bacterium]